MSSVNFLISLSNFEPSDVISSKYEDCIGFPYKPSFVRTLFKLLKLLINGSFTVVCFELLQSFNKSKNTLIFLSKMLVLDMSQFLSYFPSMSEEADDEHIFWMYFSDLKVDQAFFPLAYLARLVTLHSASSFMEETLDFPYPFLCKGNLIFK
jgi:hypothetical protein